MVGDEVEGISYVPNVVCHVESLAESARSLYFLA